MATKGKTATAYAGVGAEHSSRAQAAYLCLGQWRPLARHRPTDRRGDEWEPGGESAHTQDSGPEQAGGSVYVRTCTSMHACMRSCSGLYSGSPPRTTKVPGASRRHWRPPMGLIFGYPCPCPIPCDAFVPLMPNSYVSGRAGSFRNSGVRVQCAFTEPPNLGLV